MCSSDLETCTLYGGFHPAYACRYRSGCERRYREVLQSYDAIAAADYLPSHFWQQLHEALGTHLNFSFSQSAEKFLAKPWVSPIRGVKRFGVKGKLAPWYVSLYQILAKRREVAYQLNLPENLPVVHDVFHESQIGRAHV